MENQVLMRSEKGPRHQKPKFSKLTTSPDTFAEKNGRIVFDAKEL
jgi:hypothetical protein